MRTIKFRGKRIDNGKWVYGNLNTLHDGVFILETDQCGFVDVPDYHTQGMGCGLEDRCISDRYEAMYHGWECAIERQGELLPNFIPVDPATIGQFTGLYAQEGKEVWEGDVIKSRQGEQGKENEAHYYNGIVKFRAGSFYISGYGVFSSIHLHDINGIGTCSRSWDGPLVSRGKIYEFADSFQVIGNIHDNPELIERKEE